MGSIYKMMIDMHNKSISLHHPRDERVIEHLCYRRRRRVPHKPTLVLVALGIQQEKNTVGEEVNVRVGEDTEVRQRLQHVKAQVPARNRGKVLSSVKK
jgi:hypothetical protein